MRDYFTKKEIAEWLKVSQRTIDTMRTNDALPCFKVGNTIRFPLEAVTEWLEARTGTHSVSCYEKKEDAEFRPSERISCVEAEENN